jgi:hypothetical protein
LACVAARDHPIGGSVRTSRHFHGRKDLIAVQRDGKVKTCSAGWHRTPAPLECRIAIMQ